VSTTVALHPGSGRAATRLAPGADAGVTEAMIEALVHRFYADVRRDAVLGPIFEQAIGNDWDDHLAKLCDFWSSVLLMTGRFKGAPMAVHARLTAIEPAHFDRSLELFHSAAEAVCPAPAAALFSSKAEIIAQSLQLGIAAARGEFPPDSHSPERLLPPGLVAYRRTPEFDENTVPAGLSRAHATKAGVWGEIHVTKGGLRYRITDPRRSATEAILTPETPAGVVEPTILHEVEPLGSVRFYVEFSKSPEPHGTEVRRCTG
jgi:hemoglobin